MLKHKLVDFIIQFMEEVDKEISEMKLFVCAYSSSYCIERLTCIAQCSCSLRSRVLPDALRLMGRHSHVVKNHCCVLASTISSESCPRSASEVKDEIQFVDISLIVLPFLPSSLSHYLLGQNFPGHVPGIILISSNACRRLIARELTW